MAKWLEELDDRGRVREVVFLDAAGRPVLAGRGYARYRIDHDARGGPRRSYHDAQGRLVTTRVVIERVVSGSAAERLKLQVGDVLLRYDGKSVTQTHLLSRAMTANKGGPARPLVVLRGGKEITLQAPSPLGIAHADVAQPAQPTR